MIDAEPTKVGATSLSCRCYDSDAVLVYVQSTLGPCQWMGSGSVIWDQVLWSMGSRSAHMPRDTASLGANCGGGELSTVQAAGPGQETA
jgi:hypothetical protein